jgi:2-keto-3-deoxy-L-fuconate dehydrogenase
MRKIGDSLAGKRVLITQSQHWIGPTLRAAFANYSANVLADERDLSAPAAPEEAVRAAGSIDILIVHLVAPAPQTAAQEVTAEEWRSVFAHLVDPIPRLLRAALPGMIERRAGKIVVLGSASALRGMRNTSSYSAARGAQVAHTRAVGVEVARHNIYVNLIATNFVDSPAYFPPEVQKLESFKQRLKREVPIGRMVTAEEVAAFAVFLASEESNGFAGQVFPLAGGWQT